MTIALDHLHLAAGAHPENKDCLCLLEACARYAGEPHTAHPACVDPVLTQVGIAFNDHLDDAWRQMLIPHIPAMCATAGDGRAELRALTVVRWAVSVLGGYAYEVIGDREHSRQLFKMISEIPLSGHRDRWAPALELLGQMGAIEGMWGNRYSDACVVTTELSRAVQRVDYSWQDAVARITGIFSSVLYINFTALQGLMVDFYGSIVTPGVAS